VKRSSCRKARRNAQPRCRLIITVWINRAMAQRKMMQSDQEAIDDGWTVIRTRAGEF